MKKWIAFFFLIFIIASTCDANPGALEEVIQVGVRRILRLSHIEAKKLGSTLRLPSETSLEIATQRISDHMISKIKSLPKEKAMEALEHLLSTKHLATLAATLEEFPDWGGIIRMLGVLETAGSKLALARRSVVEQMNAVWHETDPAMIRLFRSMRERTERVMLRGERLNPDEILDALLTHADNPAEWLSDIQVRIGSGITVGIEEVVACMSLFSPVNDLIFAEAISSSLLFRRALVLEVWRSNPQAIHLFFDRFNTVLVPRMRDKLSLARFMSAFPETVFEALNPKRRSPFILQGLKVSYAHDMALRDAKILWVRLLNIKALEGAGILEGKSYEEFLKQAIIKIEGGGWKEKTKHLIQLSQLKQELEILQRFNQAFKGTEFDIFEGSFDQLKVILSEDVLQALTKQYGAEWVRKNLKMALVTTLYISVLYYFESRSEEMADPEKMRISNEDVIRDLNIKIDLAERRSKLSKDPIQIKALKQWMSELKVEREKYR